ncbi:MAG: hypothetical protein R3Y24_14950 [Eubacteriales bacterium]
MSKVEFVPKAGIDGDFKKIGSSVFESYDHHRLINIIVNLAGMSKGQNREFPEVGLLEDFLELSHMTDTDAVLKLSYIRDQINAYMDEGAEVDLSPSYSIDGDGYRVMDLTIECSNIPGKLIVNLSSRRSGSRPSSNATGVNIKYLS